MIPATAGHRALGLMFVLAVLVLCFLFLNLVLAVVYNEYSEHFKDRMKSFYAARNGKLQVGDTLVSVNGMATDGKEVAAMIAELGRNVEFVAMRKDSSRRSSIFGSGRRSSKSEAAADASPEIGGAGGAQGDVSPDM